MGDAEGLFAANQNRIFRYFCRAVGQAETARDLTQEVFLRVTRTAIPVAADGELTAWVFRIARNLALDHHRRRVRQPEPSALVDEPTRSASQDVNLAVNEALASLSALDRDVFLMREVAGLSVAPFELTANGAEVDERVSWRTGPLTIGKPGVGVFSMFDCGYFSVTVPPNSFREQATAPGSHLDSCVTDSSSTARPKSLWKSQKSRCDPRGARPTAR